MLLSLKTAKTTNGKLEFTFSGTGTHIMLLLKAYRNLPFFVGK